MVRQHRKDIYWLIDGQGLYPPATEAIVNGRWWDDHSSPAGFADFTFEPGRAYYYYHPTNFGATDFVWKPHY